MSTIDALKTLATNATKFLAGQNFGGTLPGTQPGSLVDSVGRTLIGTGISHLTKGVGSAILNSTGLGGVAPVIGDIASVASMTGGNPYATLGYGAYRVYKAYKQRKEAKEQQKQLEEHQQALEAEEEEPEEEETTRTAIPRRFASPIVHDHKTNPHYWK